MRGQETQRFNRRQFLKLAGAVSIATPVFAKSKRNNPPNIVLVMVDDFGYECLNCNGGTSYKTPMIDRMASEGMRFTNGHSNPVCTPTRVKIMTGKYNFRNYVHFLTLDPRQKTVGHIMQAGGYKTCIAGKWQLSGGNGAVGTKPEEAGFDEYCLWDVKAPSDSRYWSPKIMQNGKWLDGMEAKYGPDIFTEFIGDFMEEHRNEPFFVYYPMALTHGPHVPTPDSEEGDSTTKRDTKYMAEMVSYTDTLVGRVMKKIDQLGLRENTLVIFTGDNGTDKKITSYMGDVAIRGGKGQTIDAGTHVPLIASWKGTIKPGSVCEDLIDFSDMLPTVADTGQVKIPDDFIVDGRSFLPQLKGQKGNPKQWLYFHYEKGKDPVTPGTVKDKGEPTRWVRDKRWKLYNNGKLFDVVKDPLEKSSITSDEPEVVAIRKTFQAVLDKYPKTRQLDSVLVDMTPEEFEAMVNNKKKKKDKKKTKSKK